MATDKNLVFRVGNLLSTSNRDLESDDSTPYMRPGTQAYIVDAFGPRIFEYGKNVSGSAVTVAQFMALASDGANVVTTTVSNITSGTTTSFVTSGLTANRHIGMLSFVLDDAGAAGAAPEGETSIVTANTATAVTLDSAYPYSAALAANDDLELISNWQFEDAADGDEAWTCYGMVVAANGISDGNYGWIQREGYASALATTNAISEGDPVVAGAAIVDAFGTDGQELWVGIALASSSTDEATPRVPVRFKLLTCAGPGGSP